MLPLLQALEGGGKHPTFPKEGSADFQGLGNPGGSLQCICQLMAGEGL